MTAYDTGTEANITMTYVPAHLYYMLFELMKVSLCSARVFYSTSYAYSWPAYFKMTDIFCCTQNICTIKITTA